MVRIGLALILVTLAVLPASAEGNWERSASLLDSLLEAKQIDSAAVVAAEAESLFVSVSEISDSARAYFLTNLGEVARFQRDYGRSDSLYREALAIQETLFPDSHNDVLKCLRGLAITDLYTGSFAMAEVHLKRALEGWKASEERDSYYGLRTLINMGVLFTTQKRLNEGEEAYVAARNLVISDSIPESELVGNLRNNLANLYRYQNRLDKVDELLREQLGIYLAADSMEWDRILAAYHNLGELEIQRKNYDLSIEHFQHAIRLSDSVNGTEYLQTSYHLTSLGNAFMGKEDFANAAAAYGRGLRIKRQTVGLADRMVANSLTMYSRCYRALGESDSAMATASEAFDIRHREFRRNCWALSEDDALRYSRSMKSTANNYLFAFLDKSPEMWNEDMSRRAADIMLLSKGPVSEAMFNRRRHGTEGGEQFESDLQRYRQLVKRISRLYKRGVSASDPAAYERQMDSLQSEADALESQLALNSQGFRQMLSGRDVNSQQISELLGPGEVLLDYMRIGTIDATGKDTSEVYLVAVHLAGAAPRMVFLGPSRVVDESVRELIALNDNATGWPRIEESVESRTDELLRQLYGQLLAPVEEITSDASLLLISPDGLLNRLSFAALQTSEDRFLIEDVPLHYLSAGRDLARMQFDGGRGTGLLALGAVEYGASTDDRVIEIYAHADSSEVGNLAVSIEGERGNRASGLDLKPLPYTRREVESVSDFCKENQIDPVELLTGAGASEDNFKRMATGREMIHIATHGFFDRDALSEPGQRSHNPLLRSGLYLAGANLLDDSTRAESMEDGLLTAWEVSQMNLSGTRWVVLSACESGLGDVMTGEGVYGLRRAFLMAGSETVISTLWPVSDRRMVSMMQQLYSPEATNLALLMQQICLTQLDKIRGKGQSDHPYAWAAVIATGEWRTEK